jgi:16S rRNA (adenine1518-N6/adenine1519-N6)-dimethyltransferase
MDSAPIRPRKALGQHFLIDPNITRKILALARIGPDDTVLEIGPGRGALTGALCRAARQVIAIELDASLGACLRRTLGEPANLDLRFGDALTFPYDTLPMGTVVVSNLPYYVSTPLLFTLLEHRRRFDRLVLMLQTEVARRLVAGPSTKAYGVLSVLAQRWTSPKLAFTVSPSCFRPRPEVGSAVVAFEILGGRRGNGSGDDAFVRTVRSAFAHRRKTLANSLRDAGMPPEAVARGFAGSGIDPTRRAETLSQEEFVALARAIRNDE